MPLEREGGGECAVFDARGTWRESGQFILFLRVAFSSLSQVVQRGRKGSNQSPSLYIIEETSLLEIFPPP